MDSLADIGLGLDYDSLRLDRTSLDWVEAGARLRLEMADRLAGVAVAVEQIGSSSVEGLLAKPIIDLAIGVTVDQELTPVRNRLESAGWIYRGDAGAQLRLVNEVGDDRTAYTDGKTEIVVSLLDEA